MSLEGFFQDKAVSSENQRIFSEAKKYLNTLPSEWLFDSPVWDLTKAGQRYVTQERTGAALREQYPKGLLLALVEFSELDDKFVSIFRCNPSELWTAHRSSHDIAEIVLHWSEGRPLTPPMIGIYDESGTQKITVIDGSHRLAVARALGVNKLHVLIDGDRFLELKVMLPSLQQIPLKESID